MTPRWWMTSFQRDNTPQRSSLCTPHYKRLPANTPSPYFVSVTHSANDTGDPPWTPPEPPCPSITAHIKLEPYLSRPALNTRRAHKACVCVCVSGDRQRTGGAHRRLISFTARRPRFAATRRGHLPICARPRFCSPKCFWEKINFLIGL